MVTKPIPSPSVPLNNGSNEKISPVWYDFLNNAKDSGLKVVHESDIVLSDVTTGNVTNLRHGFAPKITGSAGYVLRSLGTTAAWQPSSDLYVNIMDHGGDNTGAANNDAAWTACLALRTSRGIAIFFPAGIYKFGGQITAAIGAANERATISIIGAGDILTTLLWPTGGGIQLTTPGGFSQHNFHVKDLSIQSGTTGGGRGLSFVNTGDVSQFPFFSTITNVTVSGSDPSYNVPNQNYFDYCIYVDAFQYINFYNVTCYANWVAPGASNGHGIGIYLTGQYRSGGATIAFAVLYNFQNCQTINVNIGLYYGPYVQGVTIDGCNFNYGSYCGIYVGRGPYSGDVLQSQLAITNTQMDGMLYPIFVESLCYQVSVIGCILTSSVTGGFGIRMDNCVSARIMSDFNANVSSVGAASITGKNCTFIGCTVAGHTSGFTMNGAGHCTVIGNAFENLPGAAYVFGSGTTGCKSTHNTFTSVGTSIGGAVYIDSGTGNTPGSSSF